MMKESRVVFGNTQSMWLTTWVCSHSFCIISLVYDNHERLKSKSEWEDACLYFNERSCMKELSVELRTWFPHKESTHSTHGSRFDYVLCQERKHTFIHTRTLLLFHGKIPLLYEEENKHKKRSKWFALLKRHAQHESWVTLFVTGIKGSFLLPTGNAILLISLMLQIRHETVTTLRRS